MHTADNPLIKSPQVTQKSIADSMASSAERLDRLKKVLCPGGCGATVTERYLNIHLDKCLRADEQSPVFERNNKKKVV